jgi:hypothetical protein
MAVGFPAKTTFADGTTLSAGDLNDVTGTLNSLVDRSVQTFQVPYAMNIGSASVSLSASSFGSVTVVFTTGRFTVAPIVTATMNSVAGGLQTFFAKVSGTTSTQVNVSVYSGGGSTTTASVPVYWNAIQMTSTTAAG